MLKSLFFVCLFPLGEREHARHLHERAAARLRHLRDLGEGLLRRSELRAAAINEKHVRHALSPTRTLGSVNFSFEAALALTFSSQAREPRLECMLDGGTVISLGDARDAHAAVLVQGRAASIEH
jgi:hypothetical protein|tara:strand:+ start:353 stop:724 length:372 start_codon:yes stop_codon:yes gene_type:complete